MVSWWCIGGVLVVTWWCLGGVLVVSWWCLGDVLVVSWWCLGGVFAALSAESRTIQPRVSPARAAITTVILTK